MTIYFTPEGIFADTEEEKLEFYDHLFAGDPVVMGHIELWRLQNKGKEVEDATN